MSVSSSPVAEIHVGAGRILLPGVTLGEGAAVGALSLVRRDVEPFTIVAGTPAKPIGERSRRLLELEQQVPPRG
jgi:acetyltransferase-like isoleucine patch superfamily enzyme